MAEASEGKRVESSREMATTNTSLYPRDLLQSFMTVSADEEDDEDEDEIELNLGLSLGGRFGVDRSSSSSSLKKLTRSSSIVGTMPIFREGKPADRAAEAEAEARPSSANRNTGLMRTTSLPVETEEEWRKRKEMQTLRRMAAKRRRNEKLRNSNIRTEPYNPDEATSRRGRGGTASPGLPRWSAAANKGGFIRQGSMESLGGGGGGSSSSLSELESKPHQASSNCGEEERSLASKESSQGEAAKGNRGSASNRLRRLSSVDMNMAEKEKSEMPCVFTKGEGPNGRRVDGILYRYGQGEEVRIMCVCHGTFLSPSDFVKHAGGADVDHPLRHIVVNTTSSSASLL